MNQLTAFIDGSQIYGNNADLATRCKILNRLGTFISQKIDKCVLKINTRLYPVKCISFDIWKDKMDDVIQRLRNLINECFLKKCTLTFWYISACISFLINFSFWTNLFQRVKIYFIFSTNVFQPAEPYKWIWPTAGGPHLWLWKTPATFQRGSPHWLQVLTIAKKRGFATYDFIKLPLVVGIHA